MPSQDDIDIPFTASHTQLPFKLLELPPELLAVLESGSHPRYIFSLIQTYDLNSSSLTINSSPSTDTTPGYAILNCGSKKYQMRQKNTSNTIMIVQNSTTMAAEGDDADTFIPQPCLTTISKIDDTIELILQEEEAKAPTKVNKWHEKFAKTRIMKKE